MSERYCASCRAVLPRGAPACPQCGVYAGDVFDGRKPKEKRRAPNWLPLLIVLAILAAGGWYYWQRRPRSGPESFDKGPASVVRQRPGGSRRAPGATINEAEAIRVLRRSLAARVSSDCLVVTSQGHSGAVYRLTALDRCAGTRLGRFGVDGKTSAVSAGN